MNLVSATEPLMVNLAKRSLTLFGISFTTVWMDLVSGGSLSDLGNQKPCCCSSSQSLVVGRLLSPPNRAGQQRHAFRHCIVSLQGHGSSPKVGCRSTLIALALRLPPLVAAQTQTQPMQRENPTARETTTP
jgi:hypothetical protein